MNEKKYDVAVIGGGIVGCATAMALSESQKISIIILEAEDKLAAHQTGNNSGVIHSGLYYKPGSMKAQNCVEGREALYSFCEKHNIAHDRCGKLVVATSEDQIPALDELQRRGTANGLQNIKRLSPEEMKEYEPHVSGIAGMRIQETGIVDFVQVTNKFAEIVQERGGEIRKNARVIGFQREPDGLVLETTAGTVHCKNLVNCAGLQS
ncbi:MAG: FAD-dependent oxidoreductase, partial [Calditrichaeota bacterium]|nr:FAD-dependent oxidoreductase [Calditrichota bacterium]